jgi:two-component system phosphate regulon sensor histidine kinase PhoR
MAELQQIGAETRPARAGPAPLARLSAAARFLALLAAALIVLIGVGALPWPGALAAFLAAAVLVALVPLRPSAPGGRVLPMDSDVAIEPAATRLAEALPDPCYILDRNGVVIFANERARAAFPLRTGDVLTARLRTPDLVAAFGRVAATGKPEMVEFVERVPTERWFAAWFSPLSGTGEQLPSRSPIVLILDDLSERRQTERVRVDFVANASHELRTPLASLIGFIDTLQGSAKDDPVARERFLGIMREQAARMSRLVDDLLSLSRIELKAHVRPRDPVDLVAVLRHVIDAHTPLAQELHVQIERRLPEGQVTVLGDRDELIQVFDNLIDNACKYGQSGGRVIVALNAPAPGELGECRVSVRDFGPGIPPEHVPRLTERFYRVESDGRQHRGTGLGLAIVKHIVTRHQGRLLIESKPGEGAAFTVVFPQGRHSFSETAEADKQAASGA